MTFIRQSGRVILLRVDSSYPYSTRMLGLQRYPKKILSFQPLLRTAQIMQRRSQRKWLGNQAPLEAIPLHYLRVPL